MLIESLKAIIDKSR